MREHKVNLRKREILERCVLTRVERHRLTINRDSPVDIAVTVILIFTLYEIKDKLTLALGCVRFDKDRVGVLHIAKRLGHPGALLKRQILEGRVFGRGVHSPPVDLLVVDDGRRATGKLAHHLLAGRCVRFDPHAIRINLVAERMRKRTLLGSRQRRKRGVGGGHARVTPENVLSLVVSDQATREARFELLTRQRREVVILKLVHRVETRRSGQRLPVDVGRADIEPKVPGHNETLQRRQLQEARVFSGRTGQAPVDLAVQVILANTLYETCASLRVLKVGVGGVEQQVYRIPQCTGDDETLLQREVIKIRIGCRRRHTQPVDPVVVIIRRSTL